MVPVILSHVLRSPRVCEPAKNEQLLFVRFPLDVAEATGIDLTLSRLPYITHAHDVSLTWPKDAPECSDEVSIGSSVFDLIKTKPSVVFQRVTLGFPTSALSTSAYFEDGTCQFEDRCGEVRIVVKGSYWFDTEHGFIHWTSNYYAKKSNGLVVYSGGSDETGRKYLKSFKVPVWGESAACNPRVGLDFEARDVVKASSHTVAGLSAVLYGPYVGKVAGLAVRCEVPVAGKLFRR
jgi:hypothetical protein